MVIIADLARPDIHLAELRPSSFVHRLPTHRCEPRESNPHGFWPRDFKSLASTSFATPAPIVRTACAGGDQGGPIPANPSCSPLAYPALPTIGGWNDRPVSQGK